MTVARPGASARDMHRQENPGAVDGLADGAVRQMAEAREETMEINWRHDVDTVLAEAQAQQRPVLLDFSAAPM
jgi:hypothetical protein